MDVGDFVGRLDYLLRYGLGLLGEVGVVRFGCLVEAGFGRPETIVGVDASFEISFDVVVVVVGFGVQLLVVSEVAGVQIS